MGQQLDIRGVDESVALDGVQGLSRHILTRRTSFRYSTSLDTVGGEPQGFYKEILVHGRNGCNPLFSVVSLVRKY